jgi:hypothetical protein
VTVKFGIKVGAMLSSLVLALVCFIGCNSDETTPPPAAGAGAAKPGAAPSTPPPVKTDEKKN